MGKASIKVSFQDNRRTLLNFLGRLFSYQDPKPFPITDILVTTMVGKVDCKSSTLRGEWNPHFKYLGIDPIKRILIMSSFRVDAEIVENPWDVSVGSHKDLVSILELTVEVSGDSPKILFFRLIIERQDGKV
jgi:hypothetical protein